MPKFSYKALDSRGQVKTGIVEALDRGAAESDLKRNGIRVQQLDVVPDGKTIETQVMKTMPREPGSGPMRVAVPPPPPSDSGGTTSPVRPARSSLPSGSIPRPPGMATLLPDPPPERQPAPEPPPLRKAPPPAREPQGVLKPFVGIGLVAATLIAITVAALIHSPAPSQTAQAHQTISLSGQLPELPGDATVVFDFPKGTDVERSVASLNLSKDRHFEVALEVEAAPESFQVRARRPGQNDLVSPVCAIQGASGTLIGELSVEKGKVATQPVVGN